MSYDAGSGAGGVHGVAEFHAQAGDDAVARALVERRQRDARQAGVGVYLESSTRSQVRLYERLGFRETGPGAWPPRAYPRPGSDIMDLGSC